MSDVLYIKIEGLSKIEILEGLGYEVRDGFLFKNGEHVLHYGNYVKVDEVKAITGDGVITDI